MKTTITTAAMKNHGPVTLGSEFCCALRATSFAYMQNCQNEKADLTNRLAADIKVLLDRYSLDMANLNIGK